jgi:hypothetical protein
MAADPERVDLSALEPFGGPEGLARVATRLAREAMLRRSRPSLVAQLFSWSRPALALAAALVVLAWASALTVGQGDESLPTASPALALAQWEQAGQVPSATTVLQVLGGQHGD